MKAVYIVTFKGGREVSVRDTVQLALRDGQKQAMATAARGAQDVRLDVYELVATAPVVSTHVIDIERVTKNG